MTLRLPCRSWLKSHRREAEQPMRQPAARLHSRENYLEISTQSGSMDDWMDWITEERIGKRDIRSTLNWLVANALTRVAKCLEALTEGQFSRN